MPNNPQIIQNAQLINSSNQLLQMNGKFINLPPSTQHLDDAIRVNHSNQLHKILPVIECNNNNLIKNENINLNKSNNSQVNQAQIKNAVVINEQLSKKVNNVSINNDKVVDVKTSKKTKASN